MAPSKTPPTPSLQELKRGGIVSIRDHLLSMQDAGFPIARTESGDPSYGPSPTVRAAITKALYDGKTHYTAGSGIAEFREAISQKLSDENGVKAPVEHVHVTSGAMHALYLVANSLLSFGDSVMMPTPTWTETLDHVVDAGGRPVFYTMTPTSHSDCLDHDDIRRKVARTRPVAFIVNSPHNPTGSVLSEKDVVFLTKLAKEYDFWIISDEAYEHIVFSGVHISPATLAPHKTISIFSCSKTDALPGLRVGFLSCPDEELQVRIKTLARKTTNGVNSLGQWGALEGIRTRHDGYLAEQVEILEGRRDLLYHALKAHPDFHPYKPDGAFYIWARLPDGFDSWAATLTLMAKGLGSAPGDVFGPGGANHIRFSFACDMANILRAVDILSTVRLNT